MPGSDTRLDNGQELPSLTASVLDAVSMTVPQDLDGLWSVVLIYRGHW